MAHDGREARVHDPVREPLLLLDLVLALHALESARGRVADADDVDDEAGRQEEEGQERHEHDRRADEVLLRLAGLGLDLGELVLRRLGQLLRDIADRRLHLVELGRHFVYV